MTFLDVYIFRDKRTAFSLSPVSKDKYFRDNKVKSQQKGDMTNGSLAEF